ncbi:hypothetical protein BG004_004594 [Podila humilis]|nr:hypothetical protein BG004_004594 [Podila humilis]
MFVDPTYPGNRRQPLQVGHWNSVSYTVVISQIPTLDTNSRITEARRSFLSVKHFQYGNCKTITTDSVGQVEANIQHLCKIAVTAFNDLTEQEDEELLLLEGKGKQQFMKELEEVKSDLPRQLYLLAGQSMFFHTWWGSGKPAPTLFVVLPEDVNTWKETDPSTHTLRLHFLCDFLPLRADETPLEHAFMHLTSHEGYQITQPEEFLERLGDYILRLLTMLKYGVERLQHRLPPLHEVQAPWEDTESLGPYHDRELLQSRIDIAISHLSKLSSLARFYDIKLQPDGTHNVKKYLDCKDENATGNLCHNKLQRWMCRYHLDQVVGHGVLQQLGDFVLSRNGLLDIHQGTIRLTLASNDHINTFLDLLKAARNSFEVSIQIDWSIPRRNLVDLLTGMFNAGSQLLTIDGISPDCAAGEFGDVDVFTLQGFGLSRTIRVLNYPGGSNQTVVLGDYESYIQICAREIAESIKDTEWIEARQKIRNEMAHHWDKGLDSKRLREVLTGLGMVGTSTFRYYDIAGNYDGHFDMDKSAFTKARVLDPKYPAPLVSRDLVELTVDFPNLILEPIFDICHSLKILNLSLQEEHMVFSELDRILCTEHQMLIDLRITFLERNTDDQGRVLAQVCMQSDGDLVFSHFDCDYISSPTSATTCMLLDTASIQHPSVLKSFTLNTSTLSFASITCVAKVLERSELEYLVIDCHPIDTNCQNGVCKILDAASLSPIKSLTLMGTALDSWLSVWRMTCDLHATGGLAFFAAPFGPSLQRLEIIGEAATVQVLSHASAMFLHYGLYHSSVVDLKLENVQMVEINDWFLVAGAIEWTDLDNFSLSRKSTCNPKSETELWQFLENAGMLVT